MISNTRGIVLKHYKYSESSIVARIFTEEFGLQSYIVKGIRSKKSSTRLALFQPLTLLDMVAYHRESRTIQHLKEVTVAFAYQHIPADINKRSVLLFLNEVLFKSIREESPDKALFNWLFNTLTWLDLTHKNVNNFHLLWMIQLSRFLGFYPKIANSVNPQVFDLQEGEITDRIPEHPNHISGSLVGKVVGLLYCQVEEIDHLDLSNDDRRKLLDTLANYYRLHLPGFGELKSMEILKTVLS